MNYAYNGYAENLLTMEADPSLEVGMAVTIKEDGKAYPCTDKDAFCGYAANRRGNYAGVQFSGFVKIKCEGEITPGLKKLGVNENGAVIEDENGRECVVLMNYDEDFVGFIF